MIKKDLYITMEDIERVTQSNMSLSHKGSNLNPMLDKGNKYIRTLLKTDRLLRLYGYKK